MFGLRFRDVLPSAVADELDGLTSAMGRFAVTEHHEDGTHRDVTADSVTLQGAAVGEIVSLAHDAARYQTSGAGVWTVAAGDQVYLRFSRLGQIVFLQFYFQTTALTVSAEDFLIINVPELHAIPTLTSLSNPAYQTGGIGEWSDITNGRSGILSISAIADNFIGTPTTSIYLQRYGSNAGSADFAQWSTTSELWLSGSITFMCQPDNIPTPFYGS